MPTKTVKTAYTHRSRVKHAGATQVSGRATELWMADARFPAKFTQMDETGKFGVPSEAEIAAGMQAIRDAHEWVRWEGSPLLVPECEGEAEDEDGEEA